VFINTKKKSLSRLEKQSTKAEQGCKADEKKITPDLSVLHFTALPSSSHIICELL